MDKRENIQSVLEKIKVEKIKPEQRWRLNWKNYFFWLLWGVLLVIGAVFLSLTILIALDLGPEFNHLFKIHPSKIFFWFNSVVPFLWVVLILLALGLGFVAFRKTKWGYRYSVLFVTILGVFIMSGVATGLHFSKLNNRIHSGFETDVFPGMERFEGGGIFPAEKRWQKPGDGFLGGEILEINKETLLLSDFGQKEWVIIITEETEQKTAQPLMTGEVVGIIGKNIGDSQFEAEFIRDLSQKRFKKKNLLEENSSSSKNCESKGMH